jgi:hypothetical protein
MDVVSDYSEVARRSRLCFVLLARLVSTFPDCNCSKEGISSAMSGSATLSQAWLVHFLYLVMCCNLVVGVRDCKQARHDRV